MITHIGNNKTVKEVFDMATDGKLIVDKSYQRRSIWTDKDKIRLIETILLKYIVPQLFFWQAETDPDNGTTTTHIVDGQQRINAIIDFINNKFSLKSKYLLEDSIKNSYGDKKFSELPDEIRTDIWTYKLYIMDISNNATETDIRKMFSRLNLTEYSLNDQERRSSLSGEFDILSKGLAEDDFWARNDLFKVSDIKRMKDIEFCAALVLLYKKGIIDQTDQAALNKAYEDLSTNYDDKENDKNAVLQAMEKMTMFLNSDISRRFAKRKSQLYTLFSVIFYYDREGTIINNITAENLDKFIELYNAFKNDANIEQDLTDMEKDIYNSLKKYKLASSEGINKQVNRKIRLDVIKEFLFRDPDSDTIDAYESLLPKMLAVADQQQEELDLDD